MLTQYLILYIWIKSFRFQRYSCGCISKISNRVYPIGIGFSFADTVFQSNIVSVDSGVVFWNDIFIKISFCCFHI